jgi:hypothetical protein
MTRHAARTKHARVESRAERDRRLLTRAQLDAPRQTAPPDGTRTATTHFARGQDAVYTFDWDTEQRSPLRPRVLRPEERPDLRSASLRRLVNLIAAGNPTPAELRSALLQEAAEQLADAIAEGISRWHTYPQPRA